MFLSIQNITKQICYLTEVFFGVIFARNFIFHVEVLYIIMTNSIILPFINLTQLNLIFSDNVHTPILSL